MPAYVLLAILASLLWGVSAGLMKHGVSALFPKLSILTLLSDLKNVILTLLKSRAWAASIVAGIAGGFCIVQAQSMGDLTVVLPLANLACAFSILFGVLFLRERLNFSEWVGMAVLIVGAVLLSTTASQATSQDADFAMLFVLTLVFIAAIAISLLAARASGGRKKEFIFSICTGLFYGANYVYLKVTTNMVSQKLGTFSVLSWESVISALTIWPAIVVILFNILGFLFMQVAFSHSRVSISHPLLTIVANMSPTIGGVIVFGERLTIFRGVGLAAIMIGALIVAFVARPTEQTAIPKI